MRETVRQPPLTLPANLPARVAMTAFEIERFLAKPRVAVLSWIAPKGEVAATPIWFRYQDGVFLLHTSHPSPKTRAILKNDGVALLIQDTAPPYRYVSVRGRARILFGRESARRRYEQDALRYYGKLTGKLYLRYGEQLVDAQPHAMEEVLIEVTPTKLVAMNGTAAINGAQLLGLRALRALGL